MVEEEEITERSPNPLPDRRHYSERDVNELKQALGSDLKKALCRNQIRIAAVSFSVLLIVGAVVYSFLYLQVADVRLELVAQSERGATASKEIETLVSAVTRRDEFLGLKSTVKDLQNDMTTTSYTLRQLRQYLDRVDSSVGLVNSTVTALSGKLSREAKAREELTQSIGTIAQSMDKLGVRLDESKQEQNQRGMQK